MGNFGHCLSQLKQQGFAEPLLEHINKGKPYMGICVGLQALFNGSTESPNVSGLGIINADLARFEDTSKSVPHIGWNSASWSAQASDSPHGISNLRKYYYVHSYAVPYVKGHLEAQGWQVATGKYGDEEFIGAIAKGNILATQFHPEKSGAAGIDALKAFLTGESVHASALERAVSGTPENSSTTPGLTKRIIACLDVRTNDDGDLVVTKGDQYDVREKDGVSAGGQVRNLGKPVELARRYYEQGADEVTFLNITSFRSCPLRDAPMLEVLRRSAETCFVPLTIGGGIRDTVDPDGTKISALEVATQYFKSGADKVSIGSDAVFAAEAYLAAGGRLDGTTAIETISAAYGNQAVVVSVDPKRVYVAQPSDAADHTVISTSSPGPKGEKYCWYQCTVRGGRETRDVDVVQLARAVEAMGCGELLLNCIDRDGSGNGFDLELIRHVKGACRIPVIASSGAGKPAHFEEVFGETPVEAALGAGMVSVFACAVAVDSFADLWAQVPSRRVYRQRCEAVSARQKGAGEVPERDMTDIRVHIDDHVKTREVACSASQMLYKCTLSSGWCVDYY